MKIATFNALRALHPDAAIRTYWDSMRKRPSTQSAKVLASGGRRQFDLRVLRQAAAHERRRLP